MSWPLYGMRPSSWHWLFPAHPAADLTGKIILVWETADTATAAARSRAYIESATAGEAGGFLRAIRGLFLRPAGALLGAAVVLLVIFLGLSNLMLWQQVNTLQGHVLPASDTRVVLLEGTTKAPGTRGYLMVFKGENYGSLVVEDAPTLSKENQYQLWLINDGKRTSGGVFSVNEQGYGTLKFLQTCRWKSTLHLALQ